MRKEYLSIDWSEVFDVDFEGKLYWKHQNHKRCKDEIAGSFNTSTGYWVVKYKSVIYQQHTIVYILCKGKIPEGFTVDHIDTDKTNNAPSNLRIATKAQQLQNRNISNRNTSGYKGVSFNQKLPLTPWRARGYINCKSIELGCCSTIEEANKLCIEFREKIHGEFARH